MNFKQLMNSLARKGLKELSPSDMRKLKTCLLRAYIALADCCKKHGLTVMLIGGSALGAVRHKGFIPWDDDLDVAMSRNDFEKLKVVFSEELGNKYILSAPNYANTAVNRFPKLLIKNTLLVEVGADPTSDTCKISIDIFIIENIPDNALIRNLKGIWCTFLMGAASFEAFYEHNTPELRKLLCQTRKGTKCYKRRMILGKLLSFKNLQQWNNIVDRNLQYKHSTSLMGIPSGRGHYFGEIRSQGTFFPVSKGVFEGMEVNLPGNPADYLSNLYGADYMTLPPEEKRERHTIVDIKFDMESI